MRNYAQEREVNKWLMGVGGCRGGFFNEIRGKERSVRCRCASGWMGMRKNLWLYLYSFVI